MNTVIRIPEGIASGWRYGRVSGECYGRVQGGQTLRVWREDVEPTDIVVYEEPNATPLEVVRNVVGAARRVWQHGWQPLPPEAVAARLQVCQGCPSGLYEGTSWGGRCLACGCYLRMKAMLATETCPRGHWATLEI
jgi:hypothetical protein